ncbi:hypothetical protein CQR46_1357 [Bifidobacterium pseudolongum subsp. globosum]|uniref:DUF3021 domain-containing protein n=1 Tax=Bifidobacterium pseudolongum subsp. globosum TaxID=1690 RepID=A0A2N3QG39_9BIFI|nr:DUF3021 family protein [Bifidobacterium pseudolongum]PKU89624.1 hypothetical protein CQR46_1357 [Bifidobacterium pseudolongum subsp. globosum]
MNHTIGKTMAVYTATGIGIAAFLAMAFSAVAGLAMGGETGTMLVKQFGVVLLCGIGYGAPAVVWTNDRLATWAKALIALVPGTLLYTAAAWWMGWIPRQYGASAVVWSIVAMLTCTAVISAICGFVFRGNVRKMNAQLKRRQARRDGR